MKRFLREHEEWLLAAAGLVISVAVLVSLVWGVTMLSRTLAAAVSSRSGEAAKIEFNLEQAAELDYKGLK